MPLKDNNEDNFSSGAKVLPFKLLVVLSAVLSAIELWFEFESDFFPLFAARTAALIALYIVLMLFTPAAISRRYTQLSHVFAIIILSVSVLASYFDPQRFVLDIAIISLTLFVAALLLKWNTKQQIIAVGYAVILIVVLIVSKDLFGNSFQSLALFAVLALASIISNGILNRFSNSGSNDSDAPPAKFSRKNQEEISTDIYKEIIEELPEGIFRTTIDGKILVANKSLAKTLGYDSVDQLKKRNVSKGLYSDEDEREKLVKVLLAQKKVKNYRLILNKKDGTEIIVRVSEKLVENEEGEPLFMEGILQDITHQVRIEEERKQEILDLKIEKKKAVKDTNTAVYTSNIKAVFLASMSHEIKTPINSIVGFLTLIEKGMFDSEAELKDFAGNAKSAADSLLDIINNVLDISKIEAGKMELDDSEFDFRKEIDKVKLLVLTGASSKNLNLVYDIDENIPENLFGDATRFRQINTNILTNAVKYTDRGEIKYRAELIKRTEVTAKIKTTITDTGRGIPDEKLPLIFKPYTQLKDKKWSQKDGAGLGLMITKEFITLMDGTVGISSKEGEGTTVEFTVILKTQKEYSKEKEAVIEKQEAGDDKIKIETELKPKFHYGVVNESAALVDEELNVESGIDDDNENEFKTIKKKKKLLLVEDNPISQKVEKKLLSDSGYDVDAVSSALDAIEAIKTNIYDLVLMDVEMPDMDGLTATQKIRSLPPPARDIPVIAVTAHSSMKDREKCLASGMNDYIAKPININFMKMTIDQWLFRSS